ncbi:MAG: hypothetical protein HZB43_12755 [candidate division Zixibacteria bacterium]|nr:hypothetical protein [candidate division Zixibacteria bacterium]
MPRIINPIRVRKACLFAADESIRHARRALETQRPWVSVESLSSPKAISEIASNEATVFLFDDVALNLVDTDLLRKNNSGAVIVLLSSSRLIQCSPPHVAQREFPYTAKADLVFAANRSDFAPAKIIASVARAAEDYLNIKKRSEVSRFILLIVDDEPSWPSQFLPVLYRIIGQRADVKITRTYEEALQFLFGTDQKAEIVTNYHEHGHGDQVVCLITDVLFPLHGQMNAKAGEKLIDLVTRLYARIPIVIATQATDSTNLSDRGFMLTKGDPASLAALDSFIRDRTGMGDFVIYDESGSEVYRASDIGGIYQLLIAADGADSHAQRLRSLLEAYGEKDKFSTWFYMHGFQSLGDTLRPRRLRGRQMISFLKEAVKAAMERMQRIPLVVGGTKVRNLQDLTEALLAASIEEVDGISRDDILSSWLDQRGYSELAEALRPVHGEGPALRDALIRMIAQGTPRR